MADHKDEEYHFSENETESSVPYAPKSSVPDRNLQHRKVGRSIIVFIAALMAFWIIYKFIGSFFSPAKQPTAPARTTAAPRPAQPMVKPQPRPIQPTISMAQIQEINEQKARLNKLEAILVNLQATLSETNTKINDLSAQVNTLTSQFNKPPPVVEIKKAVRHKKRPVIKSFGPRYSYSYKLEAAIPGRAWIMRSDGTNLTVSLGDKILGYGTVTGINPNDGVVETSSGAIIKYRDH